MSIQTSDLKVKNDTVYLIIIGILSVVIPVVVAILFYMPEAGRLNLNTKFLPLLNAFLNSATAVCLITGYIMIKKGKRRYHATAMITAFALSSIFLVSYVIYHGSNPSTSFGGTGFVKYFYYVILLSHIFLAAIVVPFVLLAIYFGITRQYIRHKKVTRYTFPVWLYVSITGVLVYLMISPYYPK
jgi:putative membrane protein